MSRPQETILEVQGMTCPSCVRHINAALTELDGVGSVEVKLKDGLVVVKHDAEAASIAQMIETLDLEGYPAKTRSL